MSACYNILCLFFYFYCNFIRLVWKTILHVIYEHMLLLIYSTLKINISSKIVWLMHLHVTLNIRLPSWWPIDLFLFNLQHTCISWILSLLQRYSLSNLFMIQLKEIGISTKYFGCLICIPWIICLTVNRSDIMNVFYIF